MPITTTPAPIAPWDRNRLPTQEHPIRPSSFKDYAGGDILVVREHHKQSTLHKAKPLIGSGLNVWRNPFKTLDDTVQMYPELFKNGHPLKGFGGWQNLSLIEGASFFSYEGRPSIPAILCKSTALACVMDLGRTGESEMIVAGSIPNPSGTPHSGNWTKITGFTPGDIVALGADTFITCRNMKVFLISEEGSLLEYSFSPYNNKSPVEEHIDARNAEMVIHPEVFVENGAMKHLFVQAHGLGIHHLTLSERPEEVASLNTLGAYSLAATSGANAELTTRREPGDLPSIFRFDCPPVGCIVRGDNTMSFSGTAPMLVINPLVK